MKYEVENMDEWHEIFSFDEENEGERVWMVSDD
jgi:hypothetical protein